MYNTWCVSNMLMDTYGILLEISLMVRMRKSLREYLQQALYIVSRGENVLI